ncbi:MAG: glycosyltransferase family 87 protein [Pseudomonadota bacterium]
MAASSFSQLEKYLTVERAFLLIVLIGLTKWATYPFAMLGPNPAGELGGDFVAFWSAARETLAGNMSALYPASGLLDAIAIHRPSALENVSGLTWQYPPHSTLIFSPFGLAPFPVAYAAWSATGAIAYAASLTLVGARRRALLALMATSIVFTAVITGQNGLFTGALIIAAVMWADKRPILAGLAAAALTIKPQIGLLLPLAYLAGRAWRPFITAAIASAVLWGGSVLIAGAGNWRAFLSSVTDVGASVESGIMPLYKMVTVFSALRLGHIPAEIALALSLGIGLVVAAAVAWVWSRTSDASLRLMAISAGALLIAPYAFYYELTIPMAGLFVLACRGHEHGWLAGEKLSVAALVLLSLFLPGPEIRSGLSLSFLCLAGTAGLIMRRLVVELAGARVSDAASDIVLHKEARPA